MYLDVYFLINLMVDRCALGCALRTYRLAKWRIWLSSITGAMGACMWEISGLPEVLKPVGALFLSMLMLYLCIGKRPKLQWFRTFLELYGFGFLLAGIIPFVSRYIQLWLITVGVSYGGIRLWLYWQAEKKKKHVELEIFAQEKQWTVKAIVDTGHQLREPVGKRPVIILKESSVPVNIKANWPIMFQSVQGPGMMMAFWPERVRIEKREYKEKEILVAIAQEWKAEGCEALVPGYLMES